MGKFAKNTTVTPDKTLNEIRATLKRYDASRLAFIEEETSIGIAFEMQARRVRFIVPLPTRDEALVKVNQSNVKRYSQSAHEQLMRSRWRGLLLVIKAKLESVEVGIETFDEAFMAQLVLPSGKTMSEWAAPQIQAAYETGTMPPLLVSGG